MQRLPLIARLGIVLLAVCPAQQLEAQDWTTNSYSRGWVNPYDNTMSNIYQSNMNLITQQAIQRSQLFTSQMIGRNIVGGGRRTVSRARVARLKSLSAKQRSEAMRFEKYQGMMYKEAGRSGTPAKVAAAFANNMNVSASELTPTFKLLLDVYKQRAKLQGAPHTDLARTMAYCIAANYYYYNGGKGVPESQVSALRSKIRTALSEDTKFRTLTNAQKQQINETLVILTHLVALGFDTVAAKAPADKKQMVREGYRKLAGINLKGLLGVAPKRVAFDQSGLVIQSS